MSPLRGFIFFYHLFYKYLAPLGPKEMSRRDIIFVETIGRVTKPR
jgi:hypothetical protein